MNMIWSVWDNIVWFGKPPLKDPWREVPWGRSRQALRKVTDYQPQSGVQHLRVLLHGYPGAGKSSFINTLDSALRGQIANRALVDTSFDQSFTNRYKSFKIQRGHRGTFYPLIFSDTMGIQKGSESGASVDELKLIMEGHIRDGFKFNSGNPQNDLHYNPNPTINDKVHVLVCVVPADKIDVMDKNTFRKIIEVRVKARDLGIPQVAILTKIDQTCHTVQYSLRNAYRSKNLKRKMERLNEMLGMPMNCIFLVKNYSEETETDEDTDTLILSAAGKIIDYGEDFLNDQSPLSDDGVQQNALDHNI